MVSVALEVLDDVAGAGQNSLPLHTAVAVVATGPDIAVLPVRIIEKIEVEVVVTVTPSTLTNPTSVHVMFTLLPETEPVSTLLVIVSPPL